VSLVGAAGDGDLDSWRRLVGVESLICPHSSTIMGIFKDFCLQILQYMVHNKLFHASISSRMD